MGFWDRLEAGAKGAIIGVGRGAWGLLQDWANPPQELPLVTRPDIGAASAQAAKDQAAYFQRVLNQNLQQNILPGITEQFGMGRLRGGTHQGALRDASFETQRQIASAVQQGAMQRLGITTNAEVAFQQMEQERAWRQARLDMGGQTDYSDIGFQLAMAYFTQGASGQDGSTTF